MLRSVRHGGSGSIVNTVVGVVAAVTIGRTLGPEVYGLYVATHAVVMLAELLASMQLRVQVARDDRPLNVAASRWVARVSGGVSAALFVAVGVILILGNGPPARGGLLILLAGHAVLAPMTAVIGGVLVARGDAAGAGLLPSLGGFVRLVLAMFLPLLPVAGRIYAIALVDTGVALLVYLVVRHRAGHLPAERSTSPARSRVIRAAGSLLMVSAAWSIVQRSDLILLDLLAGTTDAGTYSVGLRLTAIPMQFQAAALVLAVPHLRSASDGESVRKGFREATSLVLPLLLPAITLVSWAGGDIADFLFGSSFRLPDHVYLLLGLGGLVLVATGPTGPYLIAHAKDRELVRRALATITLNIALNALLIPRWGVSGAAAATAISLAWLSATGLQLTRRHAGVPPLGASHGLWVLLNVTVQSAIVLALVRSIDHPVVGFTVAGMAALATSLVMNRRLLGGLLTGREGHDVEL